ncbi:DUF1249 domain-containing protein [Saccharobesus litoralis]|uniref:DUF1249 domain-containing protein n=1 Tax=Saccharobesus litoralis TaxID=2172099 RepID=A0A2S0VVQ1_9ALTE|nr:DUF1249 domain-containing protein [Saccharobesus litoralis]AWB68180.1 DUF1249 domain-containing protein [Saccharobesus litoralis]
MQAFSNRYVPDLVQLGNLHEQNYFMLDKLVSNWQRLHHVVRFETNQQQLYQIKIIECSKYTNVIEMRQLSASLPAILQPQLEVRVYHDARLAEVVKNKNMGRIQQSYEYPNKRMMQKDEKTQNNLFLFDWLKFSLQFGLAEPSSVEYPTQ